VCAELNLAHARGGVGPQINLSILNQRQQVPQQPSDPWGLLRVHDRLNRHDRHCRSDLLQGKQDPIQQFIGNAMSGQGHRESQNDCIQGSDGRKTGIMQKLHNGQNAVQAAPEDKN